MGNKKNVSIVVPFYNEEQNIYHVYDNIKKNIPAGIEKYEMIFINDGSVDNTAVEINKIQSNDMCVKAQHLEKNGGYGAALRRGFLLAQYEYVIYLDGDGQYDFKDSSALLDVMSQGSYDIVAGYRLVRRDAYLRKMIAFIGGCFACLLYGGYVRDIDCGFKLFEKNKLDAICLHADSGVLFSLEIYLRAKKKKYKIRQMPVAHYCRKTGKSKGVNMKQYVLALFDALLYARLRLKRK